jgi:hypothetical protein
MPLVYPWGSYCIGCVKWFLVLLFLGVGTVMAEVAEFVVACTVRKAEALPSHTESAGLMPRRLEVEASSEDVDGEGDKVLQKALLASA